MTERHISQVSGGVASESRVRATTRAKVVSALTERLVLKATAAGLTVILWFIITAREPVARRWVPAVFEPVMDSSLSIRNWPAGIRVMVVGRPDDVARLESRPPIIRPLIDAYTPDSVVLQMQPADVQVPSGMRVEAIEPPRVILLFEPFWTRRVPVRSQVRVVVPSGAEPVRVALEPDSVDVSGPRLAVLRTAYVSTERATLGLDDPLPHLVAVDTTGLGVRPNPAQVRARVVIPRDTVAQLSSAGRPPG